MHRVAGVGRTVLLGVVLVVVSACGGSSDGEEPSPTVPVQTEAPSATVHESHDEACAAVDQGRVQEVDPQDLADLKDRLEHEPRVRLIGMTICGTTPAIAVGVASYDTVVPREGQAGTPIIVYHQPPISAF